MHQPTLHPNQDELIVGKVRGQGTGWLAVGAGINVDSRHVHTTYTQDETVMFSLLSENRLDRDFVSAQFGICRIHVLIVVSRPVPDDILCADFLAVFSVYIRCAHRLDAHLVGTTTERI